MKQLSFVGFCLLAAACAQDRPVAKTTTVAAAKPVPGGTGSVSGIAFLVDKDKRTLRCSGSSIVLVVPANPVTRQMILTAKRRQEISNVSSLESLGGRLGRCDSKGEFKIEGVAAGSWIVAVQIKGRVGPRQVSRVLSREIPVGKGKHPAVVMFILLGG